MNDSRHPLSVGEPAPWFNARTVGRDTAYQFDIAGGKPVLMLFFGSAQSDMVREALALVHRYAGLFDDDRAAFFGVSIDPTDEAEGRLVPRLPGLRFIIDTDHAVSRRFGAEGPEGYRPHWLVLDWPSAAGPAIKRVIEEVESPLTPDWAPVLLAPRILDPNCAVIWSRSIAAAGAIRRA